MAANQEQGLVKPDIYNGTNKAENYMDDFKAQTQDYGQKLQDAAAKAKDYATEKFAQVSDKLKELDGKDPQELIENAKDYARQKPGQALLVSAAVGLVLGLLLKGRK
ncbi:MAG: hypothetical protein ACR2GD_10485 [Pyrinomonadaceae bacterium]